MRRNSEDVCAPAELYAPRPWDSPWTAEAVIELLEPMVLPERRARINEVLVHRTERVTVLMEEPHDPHNGAAVLRSCDAFGLSEMHVVRRDGVFLAANQVAKGAERWVDVRRHASALEAAEGLVARGFQLIATHPEGKLQPEDLAGIERPALLLGNEHLGLSTQLEAHATGSVRIPMVGFVESLNVSVSAALLLYAATRCRPGDLTAGTKRELYAQSLYRTVKRADEILAGHSPAPIPGCPEPCSSGAGR